jgi:hypothetical protein
LPLSYFKNLFFLKEPQMITAENFSQGVLIDTQWMGGVYADQEGFVAFVVDHQRGQELGCHWFQTLEDALGALHRIERPWAFEVFHMGCGGGCKKNGKCGKKGACQKHSTQSSASSA